jgi:hypothetical protein
MLVFDVSINREKFIDTIHIQRVEGAIGKMCFYKIRKPEGFDDIIKHHYNKGYFPLLVKVINILKKDGYNPGERNL